MSKNKKKSYVETKKSDGDRDGDFDWTETSTYIYNSNRHLVIEEFATQSVDDSYYNHANYFYYEYDRKGKVIKKSIDKDDDGNGSIDFSEVINYEYDKRGNLIKSTTDTNYNADQTIDYGKVISYQYDREGKLIKEVEEDLHVIDYTYDNDGNLTEAYTRLLYENGEPYSEIYRSEEYQYDEKGNLVKHVDSNWGYPEVSIYKYNDEGNLFYEFQEWKGANMGTIYTYDKKGNVLTETMNHSNDSPLTYIYSYDEKGRIDSKVASPAYSNLISISDYEYDRKDNLTQILISHHDSYPVNPDDVFNRQDLYKYFYDKCGTLISETRDYGNDGVIEYEYTRSLIDPDLQLSASSLLV